jgi:parallel beta-helix repeat protein
MSPISTAKLLLLAAVFLVSWPKSSSATDYYVSVDQGDDDHTGLAGYPWKTIQKAADSVDRGDTVRIADGVYDEYVTFDNGGAPSERIEFISENPQGAQCRGLRIRADYLTIRGFLLEGDTETERGVWVDGADYVYIEDSHINEFICGGLGVSVDSSNARLIGNRLHHNGQWGIAMWGSNSLIENNQITETVQHHPNMLTPCWSGLDADGIRLFGDGHLIRSNRILDIAHPGDPGNHRGYEAEPYNDDYPHPDCIQSWDTPDGGHEQVVTNTIIERNHCRSMAYGSKGIIISTVHDSPCHDITIRNNIFEFRDNAISAYHVCNAEYCEPPYCQEAICNANGYHGGFENFFVSNNLFKSNLSGKYNWGTAIRLKYVTNFEFVNNIVVDCFSMDRELPTSGGVVDYNIIWRSNGQALNSAPGQQEHEFWNVNPLFVNYVPDTLIEEPPLPYTPQPGVNDYHLQQDSPARNSGTNTTHVTDDYNGVARPIGTGYDMGPYEHGLDGGNQEEPGSDADGGTPADADGGSRDADAAVDGGAADEVDGGIETDAGADSIDGSDSNAGSDDGQTPGDDQSTGSSGCGCQTDQGFGANWLLAAALLIAVGLRRTKLT